MIYLFQGCGGICRCLGSACKSFNETMSGIFSNWDKMLENMCHCCAGVCGGLVRGCDAMVDGLRDGCGQTCQIFLAPISQPLGGYVMLSLLLAGTGLFIVGTSLLKGLTGKCATLGTPANIIAVLCVIHIVFPFHLQRQLVNGLRKEQEEVLPSHGRSSSLQKTFRNIIIYDIGFCFFVPAFIFTFVYSFVCIGASLSNGDCAEAQSVLVGSWLLLTLCFVSVPYMCCWGVLVSICGLTENVTQWTRPARAKPAPKALTGPLLAQPVK